jgi:hypothetical protein
VAAWIVAARVDCTNTTTRPAITAPRVERVRTPTRAARAPISITSSQVTSTTPAYWPRKAGPTGGPDQGRVVDDAAEQSRQHRGEGGQQQAPGRGLGEDDQLGRQQVDAAVARGDQSPGLPAIVAGEDRRRADQQEQGGERTRGAGHGAHGPVGQVGRLAGHGPVQDARVNMSIRPC